MAIVDEEEKKEEFVENPTTSQEATSTTSTTSTLGTLGTLGTLSTPSTTPTIPNCTTPETVFAVATSFSYFLASNLNQTEIETLINIINLVVSNLSAIITQIEICQGESVISLPE